MIPVPTLLIPDPTPLIPDPTYLVTTLSDLEANHKVEIYTFFFAVCFSGVVVFLLEPSVVEDAATVDVDDSITLVTDAVSLLLVSNWLAFSVLVTAGVINPELLAAVVAWSSVVNALLVVISKVDDSRTFIFDVVSLLLVITRLEMSVLVTGCVFNPGLLTDAVVAVCRNCSVVRTVSFNALLVLISKASVDVGSVHVVVTICEEAVNSVDVRLSVRRSSGKIN